MQNVNTSKQDKVSFDEFLTAMYKVETLMEAQEDGGSNTNPEIAFK